MNRRLPFAFAFTLLVASFTALPAARADEGADSVRQRDIANGYAYDFANDAVAGGALDAQGARVRAVRHAERDVLIRPRLSFVPELLKSVENL